MYISNKFDDGTQGVIHKGRPQKTTPFPTLLPPVRRCPHLINPLSPLCGRPHLASYTALWSDSVIAGALKVRYSLISSSGILPQLRVGRYVGHVINNLSLRIRYSASPHYTLWCKSDKMNNNLYFNRHHP